MAQISISPLFLTGQFFRIIGANIGSPGIFDSSLGAFQSLNSLLSKAGGGGFASAYVHFHLMKGTIPPNLSSLTTYGARSADILVNWTTSSSGGNSSMFASTIDTSSPVAINSAFVNATQTGTAEWFWWTVTDTTPTGASPLYHQAIGTVGLGGTGADMVMDSVNIVAGTSYRIVNFLVTIPSVWTY